MRVLAAPVYGDEDVILHAVQRCVTVLCEAVRKCLALTFTLSVTAPCSAKYVRSDVFVMTAFAILFYTKMSNI